MKGKREAGMRVVGVNQVRARKTGQREDSKGPEKDGMTGSKARTGDVWNGKTGMVFAKRRGGRREAVIYDD